MRDGFGNPRVYTLPQAEAPDWNSPICFLLHGYNVEPQGALRSFTNLFDAVRRKATLLPSLLASRSWLVYWAGYASGGLASGKTLTSPLTYASQIPSACEAAAALRQYIDQESSGRAQVTLIAHSLGCRVALELLDSYATLATPTTLDFPLVVLMAAAVPTYFFEDLQRLWRGALLPKVSLVLFSEKDSILTGPFRIGQTIAGEGVLPRAVGATGRPSGGFWSQRVSTQNKHSGYFDDPATATEIARVLGQAAPRALPERGSEGMVLQSEKLPANELASRSPTERRFIT